MNLILTDIGARLASEGFISGTFPKIVKLKLGDGNGAHIEHDHTTVELANVIYEADSVAGLRQESQVELVAVIPVQVGGFTVRELGVYTANDELVAVSRTADWIKPDMGEDPTEVTVVMKILFSATQCIDVGFSYDHIYASQAALGVTNDNVQLLWDELRKRKQLALSGSSVMLDGTASLLGVGKKYFSNTVYYTGNGDAAGQAINIDMNIKNFNVKGNGSGYYLDYLSSSSTLVVKDDDDNIIPEGEISFPSVKLEIYRYDIAHAKYRYSSVIGLEKSQEMNLDTAAVETISNHILGSTGTSVLVSKVVNTLNGKYEMNAKYMNKLRWYTSVSGNVWVQAYNDETDYFISYSRLLSNNTLFDLRNPLKKQLSFVSLKGINLVTAHHFFANVIGEFKFYVPSTGVVTTSTTSKYVDFTMIDRPIRFTPSAGSGLYYFEGFANSKYMKSDIFVMSSATDNTIDITDSTGEKRLVTSFKFKSVASNTDLLKLINIKEPKMVTFPNNTYYSNNVKATDIITVSKGKLTINDFATFINPNQQYHYIIEFDSEIGNIIDTIGAI